MTSRIIFVLSNPRHQKAVLVVLWILVHGFVFWRLGIRELSDSRLYIDAADHLLSEGSLQDVQQVFYIIPVALLAATRIFFPDTVLPFVVLQMLISGPAMAVLYRTTNKVFENTTAGFFAVLCFLLWFDHIQWNTAVLTESLFCSLTIFLLCAAVISGNRARDAVPVVVLAILSLFVRPTGVVLITGVSAFYIVRRWSFFAGNPGRKMLLCATLGFICICTALVMFTLWDFTEQYRSGNIVTYIDTVHGTDLYYASLRLPADDLVLPDSGTHPVFKMVSFVYHNPAHFMEAFFLKVFYLLTGIRPYYSLLHNALILLWAAFIYTLFTIGMIHCGNNSVRVLAVTVLVVNCVLVGIATVDWDNRFYVPMLPVIVMMAGGGLATRTPSITVPTRQ